MYVYAFSQQHQKQRARNTIVGLANTAHFVAMFTIAKFVYKASIVSFNLVLVRNRPRNSQLIDTVSLLRYVYPSTSVFVRQKIYLLVIINRVLIEFYNIKLIKYSLCDLTPIRKRLLLFGWIKIDLSRNI